MKRQRQNPNNPLRAGNPATVPSKSVFINCPFDAEFEPLFDAIVFAATCCGFWPRSAMESGSVAESRMERIARAVFSSKYSIHDLSRCQGEGDENLARFNMPLELGIAMGHRMATTREKDQHDWLVLVPEGHPYVKYLSDLGGFDPSKHNGTEKGLIQAVMAWLYSRPDAIAAPKPSRVIAALKTFRRKKARLVGEWGADVPWGELVKAARAAAPPAG